MVPRATDATRRATRESQTKNTRIYAAHLGSAESVGLGNEKSQKPRVPVHCTRFYFENKENILVLIFAITCYEFKIRSKVKHRGEGGLQMRFVECIVFQRGYATRRDAAKNILNAFTRRDVRVTLREYITYSTLVFQTYFIRNHI